MRTEHASESEYPYDQDFLNRVYGRKMTYHPETGCVTYTDRGKRYPYARYCGKLIIVTRVILEMTLKRGLEVYEFALHSCDNPPCINPAHLRPGDHQANADDRVERKSNPEYSYRNLDTDSVIRTHCKSGHEYTVENTYWDGKLVKSCIECRRIATELSDEKQAAEEGREMVHGGKGCLNAAKTHCPNGHEYTPDNIYWQKSKKGPPSRRCKTCTLERIRKGPALEKTHCSNGHEYTFETTIVEANGVKRCKTCRTNNDHRRREKEKRENGSVNRYLKP